MTYLPTGDEAGLPARLGIARLGQFRLGCAFPGDVDSSGFDSETSSLNTDTGSVVAWGLGGVDGGLDQ